MRCLELSEEIGADRLFLLGDYWQNDCNVRSSLGKLVHLAKDHGDAAAAATLAQRFAEVIAPQLPQVMSESTRLIAAVPSSRCIAKPSELIQQSGSLTNDPFRNGIYGPLTNARQGMVPLDDADVDAEAEADATVSLGEILARSLAIAGVGTLRPGLVVSTQITPRMRDIAPSHRPAVAARAGYQATEPLTGQHVVLTDDVILTGATVTAVTACLRAAGAASVVVAVAARTRQR